MHQIGNSRPSIVCFVGKTALHRSRALLAQIKRSGHNRTKMSRLPHERYLLYLISLGLAFDRVNERLADLHLDPAAQTYIEQLRRKHPVPSPFRPKNKRHKPSQDYLRLLGIQGCYAKDADTRGAVEILDRPRVRELVEALLIPGIPPETIAKAVRRTCAYSVTAEVIQLYSLPYWDLSLLDRRELKAFLDAQAAQCTGKQKPPPVGNDLRRLAACAPDSNTALRLVAQALGRAPPVADLKTSLAQIRDMAIAKTGLALSGAMPDGSRKAAQFVEVARRAQEFMTNTISPTEELRRHLSGLILVSPGRTIVTLADLGCESLPSTGAPEHHSGVEAIEGDDFEGSETSTSSGSSTSS